MEVCLLLWRKKLIKLFTESLESASSAAKAGRENWFSNCYLSISVSAFLSPSALLSHTKTLTFGSPSSPPLLGLLGDWKKNQIRPPTPLSPGPRREINFEWKKEKQIKLKWYHDSSSHLSLRSDRLRRLNIIRQFGGFEIERPRAERNEIFSFISFPRCPWRNFELTQVQSV